MSYSLRQVLDGKRLVVFGGTGFLGKVWLALILTRFPGIEHIYLVVRPKAGQGVQARFQSQILASPVFDPLRAQHGDRFFEFISQKVTPMAGDVASALAGVEDPLRRQMRGTIDAVVNVAGIVDFDPPLDEALVVNAFGCQNLVAFAKDIGADRVLHTSTCYTAGSRTGPISEEDPRKRPFPRAAELDMRDWSPEREIAECLDVIEQARHRAGDAFRKSAFLAQAKEGLRQRDEPTSGAVLDEELARVRRKFVEKELARLGMERAQYWGWPNTYTYTKSIGEQIIAQSGLNFCIVRPAIVESTLEFPFPGWNEGINTSAPFIFLIREGGLQVPGSNNNLDFIPCDLVCAAITLALGELIDGTQKPVYQAASSDTNPCTMARFFELSGLYKRKYYQRTGRGGPVLSFLQEHYESALLSKAEYQAFGPRKLATGAEWLAQKLASTPVATRGVTKGLTKFATQQKRLARVMDTFLPFVAEYHYVFETTVTRAAYTRLEAEERALVPFDPARIDWRKWFMEIHAPTLEKRVFPLMEERLARRDPAPRAHATLTEMFTEACERFEFHPLFQVADKDGLSRLTYGQTLARVRGLMRELRRRGAGPGSRVIVSGPNGPEWAIAVFSVLGLGGTVVPLDPALSSGEFVRVASHAEATIAVGSDAVLARSEAVPNVQSRLSLADCLNHSDLTEQFSAVDSDALAALLFTSGTTETPKGVMLSHGNLTSLVAALGPLFPLGVNDRLVSVLPLHHTFELTCGLLLPLSRGSTITYLSEVSGERVAKALKDTRATALVGVPALWEALERRILERVRDAGPVALAMFDWGIELAQVLSKFSGVDVGRLLFGPVHGELGGHLRYAVSGGAALPPDTHALFQGLGMPLSEGYGLTEASPVLTVQKGSPRARAGVVGPPIPGVELKIESPDAQGVGEVWARGKSIMQGYLGNPEATAQVLTPEGWLRTGDLGKLDSKGRLTLVGRSKEVVIGSSGENLYPDDIERKLGELAALSEFVVLGVPDERGGERLALVGTVRAGLGDREARAQVTLAYERLLPRERPTITLFYGQKLPRTRLGKVLRRELRSWALAEGIQLGREVASSSAHASPELDAVRECLKSVVKGDLLPVAEHSLRGDLGLDSLGSLEVLRRLESQLGVKVDPEYFSSAITVSDLVELWSRPRASLSSLTNQIEREPEAELRIPPIFRAIGRRAVTTAAQAALSSVLSPEVIGSHNIPHNRTTIIFANHASHLDAGVILAALGNYGENVAVTAARDYFFEGHRAKRAFFRDLTPLVPVDRQGSLASLLEVSRRCLDEGKSVLVFPEGTRSADGRLGPFKQGLAQLLHERPTDLLPVWVEGTYQALPRGARMIRPAKVQVRVGAPLNGSALISWARRQSSGDAPRELTRVLEEALRALGEKREFDLAKEMAPSSEVVPQALSVPLDEPLGVGLFRELTARFVAEAVDNPVSYYFSLDDERWTLVASKEGVQAAPGKSLDQVDCVLKTSLSVFERIVREAYVPSPTEFLSGAIKTNNLPQLLKLQGLFQLQVKSDEFWKRSPESASSRRGTA